MPSQQAKKVLCEESLHHSQEQGSGSLGDRQSGGRGNYGGNTDALPPLIIQIRKQLVD